MRDPVLAIGPANYAGQAHAWAEAVERHTAAHAWSFMRGPVRRGDFGFPADRVIHPFGFYLGIARGLRSRRLFRGTSHLALDGYATYFRRPRALTIKRDAAWWAAGGSAVPLIARGSAARSPPAHMARLPHSYFREGTEEWRVKLNVDSARNRSIADELGLPLFVSPPDLLLDQPTATWLPLSMDIYAWAAPRDNLLDRAVPRVLHLPSRRRPPIKGTHYVDPVLGELAAAGLIEYVSPESVPHREVRALVHSCDIVVDQILTGSYGVAAIEAMAAGRVLVGNLAPDVAELMPEVPIVVNADPDTLKEQVLRILEDREAARSHARRNLEFVRRWHDGRAAAAAMSSFLGLGASATE